MTKLIDNSRNLYPAEERDGDLAIGLFWGLMLSIPLWIGIFWVVAHFAA